MLCEQHFIRLERINYNLREYERTAELATEYWDDLSAKDWWPIHWTEEQIIKAWENDLQEASEWESVAILHANALRRDLTAML